MSAKVVAFVNPAKNVGKTTTVVNVGSVLAEMGRKVLIVDLDPQATLSTHFGIDEMIAKRMEQEDPIVNIKDLFDLEIAFEKNNEETWGKEYMEKCIVRIDIDERYTNHSGIYIDILTSILDLDWYNVPLLTDICDDEKTVFRLRKIIQRICEFNEYDYVLIDCGEGFAGLLLNAVAACNAGVVVVVNRDRVCYGMLEWFIPRLAEAQRGIKERLIAGEESDKEYKESIYILNSDHRRTRTYYMAIPNNLAKENDCSYFSSVVPEEFDLFREWYEGRPFVCIPYLRKGRTNKIYVKIAKEFEKRVNDSDDPRERSEKQKKEDVLEAEKIIIRNNIASTIKYYRELKRLKKTELAEIMGISVTTLYKWESPIGYEKGPSTEQLLKLASVFNCNYEHLLYPDVKSRAI